MVTVRNSYKRNWKTYTTHPTYESLIKCFTNLKTHSTTTSCR